MGHLPDLRPYWTFPKVWENRATKRVYIPERGPISSRRGPYVILYSPASFDPHRPQCHRIPRRLLPNAVEGDIFIVQLHPCIIGEDGNAAFDDIGSEFLSLLNDPSIKWEDGWDPDVRLHWENERQRELCDFKSSEYTGKYY